MLRKTNWGQTITISDDAGAVCFINPFGNHNSGIPSKDDSEAAQELVHRFNNFSGMLKALTDALATLQRWSEHDPKAWDERDTRTQDNILTAIQSANKR